MKVAVERGLRRPLAGRVGHHQRCVETDQAIAPDVGPQGRQHVGVVADSGDVHQAAVGVDDGDSGRIATGPGEVDAGEVHPPKGRARGALEGKPRA